MVVGGGDGTLSAAAEALAGGDVPLGVLPLGTRNHFARDLGLPDWTSKRRLRVIAAGHVRRVDVGEVNGRVFINNCSLGVYPDLVRDRESAGVATDRRRFSAMVRAGWGSLRRFRVRTVTLRVDGRVWRATTPLVFVGNNRYETRLFGLGRRDGLEEGRSGSTWRATPAGSASCAWCARMLLGPPRADPRFRDPPTPELEVRTRRPQCGWPWTGKCCPWCRPCAGGRGRARCPCSRPPAPA